MERLIIYLHRNVNNSKFIKKNLPLKFDQHPPLNPRRPISEAQQNEIPVIIFKSRGHTGVIISFKVKKAEGLFNRIWSNRSKQLFGRINVYGQIVHERLDTITG